MKRVAIFRTDLLALSETFIRDQAGALRSWQPLLVGRRELDAGLETPGLAREIVPEVRSGLTGFLRFWLWRPDPMLVSRLQQLKADLVHAHFGVDASDIWPSVKAAGLPMIVTLHGFDINTHREWWEAGRAGKRRRLYPRRLLEMARDPAVSFVAVSEAIKRRAIEYGIPPTKVSVVYTGVDTERFRPDGLPLGERANRILFVGRMIENKAPALLVRAAASVGEQLAGVELTMIGDGPELEATRSAAREHALRAWLPGPQSVHAVLEALRQAKVVCLPSQQVASGAAEGLGQVLLEAQACGVPVVGSSTGGIPETLEDGVTGYVFRSGDQAGLQNALLTVLGAGEQRLEAMSSAARRLMLERFDLRRTTRRLEALYDSAVAGAASA